MKKVDYYNFFIIYKKWVKQLIIKEKEKQYKIEPKKYYENNKEKLRAPAKNNCRELYEEEKDKKKDFGRNRYANMPEENKQRLKEYQKNYKED